MDHGYHPATSAAVTPFTYWGVLFALPASTLYRRRAFALMATMTDAALCADSGRYEPVNRGNRSASA